MSLRLILISITPFKNEDIDLQIYRDAGQLVANGVNPYDFNDNVELRKQLRTDKDNFNEWVCSDQEKWNYYANSNLPLASLFFGGIEYCFASPKSFRYTFAFFDSILAVLILAFVINKWQYRLPHNRIFNKLPPKLQHNFPLLIGLSLGALSPILFLWGTYMPEPKGMGLLLILSSIYFSDSSNKKLSMFVSPVLLGFSVAFIGLGIFIGPLCLYNIYKNDDKGYREIVFYCLISFLACAICFAPFLPELLKMMLSRMRFAVHTEPQHGSMWSELFKMLPNAWLLIKNVFIVIFVSINIIGFLRKRLNVTILSANLLYLFTIIYLMNGSMDRMNIALITLIILLGYSQFFRITTLLWLVYLPYGIFSFFYSYYLGIRQDFDGVFVFSFTVLYFAFLIVQTFAKKSSYYETISSYTRL
jgi:hypothetical protein